MAHILKIKRFGVGQIVAHDRRLRLDGRYRNENIDPERTRLNYRIDGVEDVTAALGRAIEGTPAKKLRKDAVAMFSIINTLPADWPEDLDPRVYFEACHAFNKGEFPTAAPMGMEVHLDETTPHAHDLFLPTTEDGRFNYADVVPRSKYQRYHQSLRRYLQAELGLDLAVVRSPEQRGQEVLERLEVREYADAKDELRRAEETAQEAEIRAESARSDLEAVESSIEAANERLERLRRDEESASAAVGIGEEELKAIDKGGGERREYVDSHKGDGAREATLAREVEELRERAAGLEQAVAESRGAVERAESGVRVQEGEAEALGGRLRAAERALEVLRAAVGHLAERFRRLGGRVAGAVSVGWRRYEVSVGHEALGEVTERGMTWQR